MISLVREGLPQSSTVQDLIHTGLEPGDRGREEMRETVLTVSSSFGTTKLLSTRQLRDAQTEKPLKRFLDQFTEAQSPG